MSSKNDPRPHLLLALIMATVSACGGQAPAPASTDAAPKWGMVAVYGEYKITVEIESGKVRGEFPARAERLVLEWAELHTRELLENWERARERQPLQRIAPLE